MSRTYRVISEVNCAYFVTSTIVDWLPVFVDKTYCDIVVESLKFIRVNKRVQINAFVIMPTHLHLVVMPDEKVSLSDVMRDFKRFTSKAISAQWERDDRKTFLRVFGYHAPSRAGAEYRVWQEGFHPEPVFRTLAQAIGMSVVLAVLLRKLAYPSAQVRNLG